MQTAAEAAWTGFAYRAQTREGAALSGTIDAPDIEQAKRDLEALHLQVLQIEPAEQRPPRGKPLRGDDFIAFNQQLGFLTQAGLPMEHSLRLIAEDLRSGRLAQTIRQIAQELETGRSLGEVFQRHQNKFPALYGRLLEAGVKSNNLPGMLFNLSRHLELTRRLQGMLWRVAAYPLMVLIGLTLVTGFLGLYVLPQFEVIFNDFKVNLPDLTKAALAISHVMPEALTGVVALVVGLPLLWILARVAGLAPSLRDWLVLPLPLIGPVIKKSLLAGWCDAVRMGVEAGLDLPAALGLAGETCGSPQLRRDSQAVISTLNTGVSLDAAAPGKILPATVIMGMALGAQHHDLTSTLASLSDMYQQQADVRLNLLPSILTPLLVLAVAALVGLTVLALLMPLLALIGAVSGG